MCGSMVDILSATAEIKRGKRRRRRKKQYKNIMSTSVTQGGHNESGIINVLYIINVVLLACCSIVVQYCHVQLQILPCSLYVFMLVHC